jgi:uncharacterized protein YoxC
MDHETVLIIFVALTGLAVLMQACVLLGMFLTVQKAVKLAQQATDEMKKTVYPLVHSSRELLEKMGPQVITITNDMASLTQAIKRESSSVHTSISEILERVDRQTARLDAMLTSSLTKVEKAGSVMESAVAAPVRQANGVIAAFKAIVETYRKTTPPPRPTRIPEDPDMFV